jgi:TonB family protein
MRPATGLFALLLLAAPAVAQDAASGDSKAVLVPSQPVAGTHTCTGYYPDASRQNNEAGKVLISYDVEASGTITNVRVARTSGSARLDAAAVRCVSEAWRNTPAMRGGVAVPSPNHMAYVAFELVAEPAAPPEPAFEIGAEAYVLIGVVVAVFAGLILFLVFRRRGPRGPAVCPNCGTINIPGDSYLRPDSCAKCGTKLTG